MLILCQQKHAYSAATWKCSTALNALRVEMQVVKF